MSIISTKSDIKLFVILICLSIPHRPSEKYLQVSCTFVLQVIKLTFDYFSHELSPLEFPFDTESEIKRYVLAMKISNLMQ